MHPLSPKKNKIWTFIGVDPEMKTYGVYADIYIYMYVCMYVCMYNVFIYVCIYIYIMYLCMYIYIYEDVCVCVC